MNRFRKYQSYPDLSPPTLPTPCQPGDLTAPMKATMPEAMQEQLCQLWNLATQALPAGLGMPSWRAWWFVIDELCYTHNWTRKPDGSYVRLVEEGVAKAGKTLSAATRQRIEAAKAELEALLAENEPEAPEAPKEGEVAVEIEFAIAKVDPERQLVFGYAYVAQDAAGETVVDHSGEMIDPAELEEAVYAYFGKVEGSDNHESTGIGQMVESVYLDHAKLKKMGATPNKAPDGAWWVGFKVTDAEVWKKVKAGEYEAFSIGGTATKEAL
jgi:predicted RNase H-like HicB family nuclease